MFTYCGNRNGIQSKVDCDACALQEVCQPEMFDDPMEAFFSALAKGP